MVHRRKKQHFGRKYKVVFVRAMYGTPLNELDLIAHWAQDVKQQHYAQLPARDPVAQLLDFPTAMQYYLERADLDPGAIREFQAMVNSILPWLGVKLARAEQVNTSSCQCMLIWLTLCLNIWVWGGVRDDGVVAPALTYKHKVHGHAEDLTLHTVSVASRVLQVLHATAASQRDRTAVDTLRALVRIRVWFWQTLPFVFEEFPNLPCWDWPVFK